MNFYSIDNALQEAVNAADKPVRLKIEIQTAGYFETINENDIIEANFYGLKEKAGGTSSRGELLLKKNEKLEIINGAGREVHISFSLGEGLPVFKRFIFYIDDKGIQDIRGSGRKRFVFIVLRD